MHYERQDLALPWRQGRSNSLELGNEIMLRQIIQNGGFDGACREPRPDVLLCDEPPGDAISDGWTSSRFDGLAALGATILMTRDLTLLRSGTTSASLIAQRTAPGSCSRSTVLTPTLRLAAFIE